MPTITDCFESVINGIRSKIFRVSMMFVLTMSLAIIEIICGIRAHSNALIADGLYSFAEGVCLLGVIIVLRYVYKSRQQNKNNTFGYERLELLFGLIQEVFLLSVSLGIIVDAINHLVNPGHVHDPDIMIKLGIAGFVVGLLGMLMFWGYHHDHDIKEEISDKRMKNYLAQIKEDMKLKQERKSTSYSTTVAEAPLTTRPSQDENNAKSDNDNSLQAKETTDDQRAPMLNAFTYENVEIDGHKVYATLHALCLHSFVVLLESVIVSLTGLLIKYVPHVDSQTGKEINVWLKYIDPLLTLAMVVVIAVRSIPVILSISDILIDSVPNGIDTRKLMNEILTTVPSIKSIHNLHIWRSAPKDICATMHFVCSNDIPLSQCAKEYVEKISSIFKTYCIRYYTLQLECLTQDSVEEQLPRQYCINGIERKRLGHATKQTIIQTSTDATVLIPST